VGRRDGVHGVIVATAIRPWPVVPQRSLEAISELLRDSAHREVSDRRAELDTSRALRLEEPERHELDRFGPMAVTALTGIPDRDPQFEHARRKAVCPSGPGLDVSDRPA